MKPVSEDLITNHEHTGRDSAKVKFDNLASKRLFVSHTIPSTSAATAANYAVFFIVPVACRIASFKEVHQVLGTNGGAVTLQLEKLTSGEALDAGDEVLSSAINLKATINVVQSGTLKTTKSILNLAPGDRLALKDAGTLTSVANVTVLVELIF